MTIPYCYLGCDVSKSRLDIFDPHTKRGTRLTNTPAAIAAFLDTLAGRRAFFVFEATDPYDRPLRAALQAKSISSARLNPMRVKRFAQARGAKAKTDPLDAAVLSAFGETLQPPADAPVCPKRQRLAALQTLRDQLVHMRAQEKTRFKSAFDEEIALVHQSLIEDLSTKISDIEARIQTLIKTEAALAERAALLRTAPGVGPVSAAVLLCLLPELGAASPKHIASLAGLAPFACDSGAFKGARRIAGGRRRVRNALYMASLSVVQTNTRFRTFYQTLIERGKPKKAALIAVARKLLITLNAMIRDKKAYL